MNIQPEVLTANGRPAVLASRGADGSTPTGARLTAVRCLLVDDHPAVRVGLRELVAAEPDFEVLDALATAEAAVAFAERTRVDIAVVDYQLGGHSGLWVSRKLKRLPDPPAVLIYSAFSDYLLAAACVVAQADGLVSKAALGSDLCDRIREAARGVSRLPIVPPSLADSMRRRLDPEEQAIFGLLLAGIATEEIGCTLGLGHGELEARLWTMLRKLERLDPVN
jgi:two-component system, NarL family, response regulator DevR